MATIVCQGLQSCLESHLVEPRTLRLKLSSSSMPQSSQTQELLAMKSCFPDSNTREEAEKKQIIKNHLQNNNQNSKKSDVGGWSFLQALSNGSSQEQVPKETIYVHPLVKRPSSTLSEKSLKLCTENLGNETGTDMIMESNIFSEELCSKVVGNYLPRKEEQDKEKQKQSQGSIAKKAKAPSFPPPLTTISGRDCLQVRHQRVNGRLIIEAVKAPSKQSCFQAERSNGRLRLCLLENFAPRFDSQLETGIIDGKEINEKAKDENDSKEEEDEEEDVGEEACEGKRDGVEVVGMEKEMDGNYVKAGGEIGMMEKYERPSCRCKEGSEQEKKTVVLNWEPLWVTS